MDEFNQTWTLRNMMDWFSTGRVGFTPINTALIFTARAALCIISASTDAPKEAQ